MLTTFQRAFTSAVTKQYVKIGRKEFLCTLATKQLFWRGIKVGTHSVAFYLILSIAPSICSLTLGSTLPVFIHYKTRPSTNHSLYNLIDGKNSQSVHVPDLLPCFKS